MSEEREMTLDEWVNRLPEFHLANKQYQQQQQRIAELERQVANYKGGFEVLNERNNQNISDYELLVKTLREERDKLAATVERLRDKCQEVCEVSENHYNQLTDAKAVHKHILGLIDLLESTPQQNLNHVKREVAISAALTACRNVADARFDESDFMDFATQYANTMYPSSEE